MAFSYDFVLFSTKGWRWINARARPGTVWHRRLSAYLLLYERDKESWYVLLQALASQDGRGRAPSAQKLKTAQEKLGAILAELEQGD